MIVRKDLVDRLIVLADQIMGYTVSARPKGCRIERDLKNAMLTAVPPFESQSSSSWFNIIDSLKYKFLRFADDNVLKSKNSLESIEKHTEFSNLSISIMDTSFSRLSKIGMTDIADEVDGAFACIFYYHAVKEFAGFDEAVGAYAKLPPLLEKGYAAGGWPCGWNGDFPDGNMILYWPHEKDPNFEA